MTSKTSVSDLSITTIRTLTIDSVEKAQHGHPGMPMGTAPLAYALWTNVMNHNPKNPDWFNRDRFVLSAGHGSMLIYSLLHLTGYDLSLKELQSFRQWGSKTPGHPEFRHTPGVETTTGPLGQGVATSVGMAMAEAYLAAKFNRPNYPIVDHFTYCLCGDGDLMEGVANEAISLAGHQQLGKLIMIFDSNDVSLDGDVSLSYSEDVKEKFEACGWEVLFVSDGNNIQEVETALMKAKLNSDQPTLIEIKTTIGFGSSIAGTHEAHSDPLGIEEIKKIKEKYQWSYEEDFYIPDEVKQDFERVQNLGQEHEEKWNELLGSYQEKFPSLADEFFKLQNLDSLEVPTETLPSYEIGSTLATRNASGESLNILAKEFSAFIGGSADLDSSTKTRLLEEKDFSPLDRSGRNIRFGVREFAMAATANGLALHHLRPFVSTFFVFSDYLRPALRLSALMQLPVTYVFTHDSIAVGQDGPTHQPVEQLASLRAMPGLTVIRPADANETKEAWKWITEHNNGPVALILGRQKVEVFAEIAEKSPSSLHRGAYILSEPKQQEEGIIIATGSEVELAMKAKEKLEQENIYIRVVNMPSWELFEQQDDAYKQAVLPLDLTNRVVVEMGSKLGWREYASDRGIIMSVDEFGASGPGDRVIQEYGFTVDNVVANMKKLLEN